MKYRSIIIAMLIVFAIGGIANKDSMFGADRAISRTVNRMARWGLRLAILKRFHDRHEVQGAVPEEGEISHRDAL